MASEEVALAVGTIDYWKGRCEQAERERDAARALHFMAVTAIRDLAAHTPAERLGSTVDGLIATLQASADQLEAIVMAGHGLATAARAVLDPQQGAPLFERRTPIRQALVVWNLATKERGL